MPTATMISSGSESTLKTSATCATASPSLPPPQTPPRTWLSGTNIKGLAQLTIRPSSPCFSLTHDGSTLCFRSTAPSPTSPAASSNCNGPNIQSLRARRRKRMPLPRTSSIFVAKVSVSLKRQGQSWAAAPATLLLKLLSKSPNSVSFVVEPRATSRKGRWRAVSPGVPSPGTEAPSTRTESLKVGAPSGERLSFGSRTPSSDCSNDCWIAKPPPKAAAA
mmetsp:Transcript_77620/g.180025  ORF Transcript_77620/g.180025 Transcript_77620/m.180025 type:complete len:220 (+) Transcript_77620:1046-1705(+)